MAKNSLHIKNTQLAEAINLSGLKAKLSRKKAGSPAEEAKGSEVEEITFSTLKEPSQPSTTSVQESAAEAPVFTESEPVQEKADVEVVHHEAPPIFHEPEPISPPLASTTVASTKLAERTAVAKKSEPGLKAVEPSAVQPMEFAQPEKPVAPLQRGAQSEKGRIAASRQSEVRQAGPSSRSQKGREKEALPVRPFTPTPVAPRPPPAPRAIPAPFISAARNNPDQLGPVVREPPPPAKIRPRPPEARERGRRDEEEIFVSGSERTGEPRERPPFRPGERPPYRPGERPPYRAGERPPYRPGERPPFRTGEGSPRVAGSERRFEGPRPFDRQAPPSRPMSRDADRSSQLGWAPPALGEEGDRIRRSEPDKKQKVKSWDPKQKPAEIKGAKTGVQTFDARLRRGLGGEEDESSHWRRRRPSKHKQSTEQLEISRPSKISVRLPISVKDLAVEMKLKASQLISKLFLQGTIVTLNDLLSDETQVQLLGSELGCEVEIDKSEQERIRITDKSIGEEIALEQNEELVARPPVVTFMGHVDHGKTSLIDAIRKSNRAAGEVGAITQHIGALTCSTDHGRITIIDTPGHEAFSAMRERGASITDVVVLVVAGDEGIKEQTLEAIKQAKESKATIIVAINKSDKPNFDQDRVFRQLAEVELLPEAWGGSVVTVPCSALTGAGIKELLEMISLQSEVLELRANPSSRARGTVVEAQMSKGLGLVATILVQNGTLRQGDCLVFGSSWARVKSMRDDLGNEIVEAGPSVPVRITGISDLPTAGEEFIVVKSEKEARNIAENRKETLRQQAFLTSRRVSLENMMEKASTAGTKKFLNIVLRADVQGSLEAIKTALQKIESNKVAVNIISYGVGEISESDVELAATSKATILGFHTTIEAHAEPMVKTYQVPVRLHSIIYHAQDDIRALMKGLLDKLAEEQNRGKAEVKALFKSSQLGTIAGCIVVDGTISRNCNVRVIRDGQSLWQGPIASLKRFKEDVKEVTKGTECGIVLQGFSAYAPGDVFEAYEVVYHEQDL